MGKWCPVRHLINFGQFSKIQTLRFLSIFQKKESAGEKNNGKKTTAVKT